MSDDQIVFVVYQILAVVQMAISCVLLGCILGENAERQRWHQRLRSDNTTAAKTHAKPMERA